MPNPITNFRDSSGVDLGNILITKEYLMTVYPQIARQLITPELWTWGYNYGASGTNEFTQSYYTPVTTLAGGANWKQVTCGNTHTAAIKTDGTLWTWGLNSYGQLGDNTIITRSTPVTTFAGGTNWKQVSGGGAYTAAIKTDGTLWTWGYNNSGQLGDNTTTQRNTPVTTFAGGTNWKQVGAGGQFTAAIKTDGTLWTWGRNYVIELGINVGGVRRTPVTTFAGGTNWKQVDCGYNAIAAVKTDGTLWTWGQNYNGRLGTNDTNTRSTPVTTFAGGTNWKQVSYGGHAAAIKTDGTLWTWGRNSYAALGDNTTTDKYTPVTTFAGGTNWKQVSSVSSVYGNFTMAIKTDGTLWCWGSNGNGFGRLGDNTGDNKLTPITTFAGGTNWKQVAVGSVHTAAIKTSDDLQGI